MTQVQDIRIHLEGIATALKTHKFKVPEYQRSYAWEKENVQSMLSDINDAINSKEKEYFLGSIVVTGPQHQYHEVVDGQQRMATICLIITKIKNHFLSIGETQVANNIKSDYLLGIDRRTKEKEPKLTLNEIDNDLFQEMLDCQNEIDYKHYQKPSHQRLIDAYAIISAYFDELMRISEDPEDKLHCWLDYLEQNAKIITVTAPDDSNAFVIFETLNDRGLELAISDLLKNYLFHKSGDRLQETKNRWLSMVATLESATENPNIVTYLRHFSMSKWGLIREKELYGLIKKKINSKAKAISFSNELLVYAKVYSALLNHDNEYWNTFNTKVRESINALNILGMTQVRPLLLAILEKFDTKNASTIIQLLVSVSVRFQISGTVGSGPLEKIYSETAKLVAEGAITTPNDIIMAFTTLPTDDQFKQSFSIATISKPALARYYLRILEEASSRDEGREMVPNRDVDRVNLEHILPLTPSDDWMSIWTNEDIKIYQKRLGNLALMSSRANSSAGNDDFPTKLAQYSVSKFKLTKMVSENATWTKTNIELRQIHMAELALKAWPIKISK